MSKDASGNSVAVQAAGGTANRGCALGREDSAAQAELPVPQKTDSSLRSE